MIVNYLFYVFSIMLVFSSFILECEFLALLFITIYAGAIAILFLFAVMMLETKLTNLSDSRTKYVPIGIFLGMAFLIPVVFEISAFFGNVN